MGWDDVLNQDRAKRMLAKSLAGGRLAHAYLFSGPEGVGKYALALELAKTLNCERSRERACNECRSCSQAAALQHPDIHLVFALPVGRNEKYGDPPLEKLSEDDITAIREEIARKAGNPYYRIAVPRATTIKVNSIRDLRRESSLSVHGGGKKMFIILDAEAMNDEASNALLKTLEEPNEHVVIVLTTSRPERLLPTIVSRCQHLRLEPLDDEIIRSALVRSGIDDARASEAARMSDGSYARALQIAGGEPQGRREEAIEFLRTMLVRSRGSLVQDIDRLASELDRPSLTEVLLLMQHWLREAMRMNEGLPNSMGDEELEGLKKFTTYYPRLDYVGALTLIDRTISLLQKNVYIPLVLLDLAVRMKKLAGRSADAARAGLRHDPDGG